MKDKFTRYIICFVMGLVTTATLVGSERASVVGQTLGPKFHWFGYYDKLEFDRTEQYVLGMEVDFQDHHPKPDDVIKIGMLDLNSNKWIELGESRAWCWQQGCMLQWLPGSDHKVIWNDRDGDRFVCRILDTVTRKERMIAHPVYSLHPNGREGLTLNFSRLNEMRIGYGYAGIADVYANENAPANDGIYRLNLETGKSELIISTGKLAVLLKAPAGAKLWINHMTYNPDGSRFSFFVRWQRRKGSKGKNTRVITSDPAGKDIRVLNANGDASHYAWMDPDHFLVWLKHSSHGTAFYVLDDKNESEPKHFPTKLWKNSHINVLPDGKWIVGDSSYPENGMMYLGLHEISTGKLITLESHLWPKAFTKDRRRIDPHPRFSPSGTKIAIDYYDKASGGRQIRVLDISEVIKKTETKTP